MSKKKINIVLDLDNTVINSLTPSEFKRVSKNKINKFKYHYMDDAYIVFERPHLQEFLDFLFDPKNNFEVSIWTAASKSYAIFIINNIILNKPGRKLDFVLYSQHCVQSQKYLNCIKDLSLFWNILDPKLYNKKNTYIVDDLEEVQIENDKNIFKAPIFDVLSKNSENDDYLLKLIKELKELK
jgi:hypothetical protein